MGKYTSGGIGKKHVLLDESIHSSENMFFIMGILDNTYSNEGDYTISIGELLCKHMDIHIPENHKFEGFDIEYRNTERYAKLGMNETALKIHTTDTIQIIPHSSITEISKYELYNIIYDICASSHNYIEIIRPDNLHVFLSTKDDIMVNTIRLFAKSPRKVIEAVSMYRGLQIASNYTKKYYDCRDILNSELMKSFELACRSESIDSIFNNIMNGID